MAKTLYHEKLVRDFIPKILAKKGIDSEVYTLDEESYRKALRAKLQEEVTEFLSAKEENKIEELADILEVVYAIAIQNNVPVTDLERVRSQKAQERGSFTKRLFLKKTTSLETRESP